MSKEYFGIARKEIIPYLPTNVERVLELGCGTGATLALVKSMRQVAWSGGVELDVQTADSARLVADKIWCGDVEKLQFDGEIKPASMDLILCLDVLEHLVDPWKMVKILSPLLSERGRLIISIPNVRNWKFIRDLLFKGKFEYKDAGLLDRTHLRFFVRDTAIELAECGGLTVVTVANAQPWKRSDFRAMLSTVSLSRLEGLLVKQWLVVASWPNAQGRME